MFFSCRPAPALRHLVRYYYSTQERLAGATRLQPVPARSPQILEFTFGTLCEINRIEQSVVEPAGPVTIVGAKTHRLIELMLRGQVDMFTVAFQPGGVETLFGVAALELTDMDFDGADALSRSLSGLYARLGETVSFGERARIVDEYLYARRPAADTVSGIVRAATHVLLKNGRVRVADLAVSTGLGMRQFERRFRHEIGIAPKLYARIVRFEAALRIKAGTSARVWTDIAHALGYHDQMHMVHDFHRLAGDSPKDICDRLGMFVQPEVNNRRFPSASE